MRVDVLVRATSPQYGEFIVLNELQLRYKPEMPKRMRAYAALAEEKYNFFRFRATRGN